MRFAGVAVALSVLAVVGCKGGVQPKTTACGAGYETISDGGGAVIKIVVPEETGARELRTIMSRVADCHQDDASRRFARSQDLEIEGYLRSGSRTSVRAAHLRRVLPPGTAAERAMWPAWLRRIPDIWTNSVGEARESVK
jgi:hypothetical protein